MKILFFDLETTGLDNIKHGIHQLSGCVVINGEVKEQFNFKIQPFKGALISEDALKIANVTIEQLREYPPLNEVYDSFVYLLGKYVDKFNSKDKFFLAGFNNASFDNQFLRNWFSSVGDKYFGSWFWSNSLDVMVLASPFLAEKRHTMENFKLRTVAATLGIEVEESKLHDAQYDVDLTFQIFNRVTISVHELR